jgi:hypothetical protein
MEEKPNRFAKWAKRGTYGLIILIVLIIVLNQFKIMINN